MKLLMLLLLSPAIFALRHKSNDPNDEPFLPIYPVYPYSPKLIKRGTERELTSQLTPELYAPKVDAKDSYSSSYSNNYQRDSYYPNYDLYSKTASPSMTYPSYYNGDAYTYTNSPYAVYNSYPIPYTVNPASFPAPSYPNYYYQTPYYYPHYFNHALLPPLPPQPSGIDYRETSQDSTEAEDDKQDKDKKSKEDETNQDAPTSQFVDGGNYISSNLRDLDGQSSMYKIASPYNQLERDVRVKNLPFPLPKTTYRVISVAGKPVGPDYPLPPTYIKAQQMEQLSQTLAKLLAQKPVDQSYNNRDILNNAKDGSYTNPNGYNSNAEVYVTLSDVSTQTSADYTTNAENIAKVKGEKINQDLPSRVTSDRNAKYSSNVFYVEKPTSQIIADHSQGTYISVDNRNKNRDRVIDSQSTDLTDEYESYDATNIYDSASSSPESKQETTYDNYENQPSSYQNKDLVSATQTPRKYSYQFSDYDSDQTVAHRSQQNNAKLDDGNFGAKRYNKG